jgi:hypothetical protein
VPHPDDAFCPFFHRPAEWPYTHHVHVVEAGGDEERRTLAFRDYLRTHDDVAREYEALKHRLAPHHAATDFASRQAYADAKGPFIAAVERALSEATTRREPRFPNERPETVLIASSPITRCADFGWRRALTPRQHPRHVLERPRRIVRGLRASQPRDEIVETRVRYASRSRRIASRSP